MSQVRDFGLTENFELSIKDGDFELVEADDQHVTLLLLSQQGEWKQSPVTGVGLRRYQNGPMGPTERAALERTITIQLERDGYQVTTLEVSPDAELTLDAFRK